MHVSVNLSDLQRTLGQHADQLAFATALALTRTAEEHVAEEKRTLPQYFTIRNGWVQKGFRVRRATKTELVATALHLDPYMGLQETAGTKRPSAGKRNVAIPVGARPTPSSTTPRSKWPGRLKRTFVIKRGEDTLVMQRTGRRGKKGKGMHKSYRAAGQKDPNVRLMYVLQPTAKLTKRWGFTDRAVTFFNRRFPTNLSGFLTAAIRTAR